MKKSLFLLLVIYATSAFPQSAANSLHTALSEMFTTSELKGLGIAIFNHNEILYKGNFGYADVDSKRPYTSDTFQPIGSVSKTLIGVSLMKAQEMGLLQLDDDVNDFLPFKLTNPYYPDEKISIRHLATHSATIKDTRHYEKAYIFSRELEVSELKGLKKYAKKYNTNEEMEQIEFLKRIYSADEEWYSKKNFLNVKPGEKYEYSNNGAALASLVIASATGMEYKEFVRQHILDPLEMKESGWDMNAINSETKAKLYVNEYPLPDYKLITYADGGFVTSINEMIKYYMGIMNGHLGKDESVLSKASFQEMFTAQFPSKESMGVFWVAGKKRIGHTGGDPGLATVAFFNRDNPIAIILFTNTNEGIQIGDFFKIADKYAGKL